MASILATSSFVAATTQAKVATKARQAVVAPLAAPTVFAKPFATGAHVLSAAAAPRQARMMATIR